MQSFEAEQMSLEPLLKFVPVFVLVLFRIAGFMVFAPLFGSTRIPKRVKVLLALIMAMGLTANVAPPLHLPETIWGVTLGIAGEMCFGLAMGMILGFIFIAAQWAGEIVGQQIGINYAETFDPQYGGGSTLIADLYYMLTLMVFLIVGGHRQMVRGLRDSFDHLPLLSVGINASVFDLVIRMFESATVIAARLAAPILVTMMVVDIALGFLGKTMPQLNVMSAGMSLKVLVGTVVLVIGMSLSSTSGVIHNGIDESINAVRLMWAGK